MISEVQIKKIQESGTIRCHIDKFAGGNSNRRKGKFLSIRSASIVGRARAITAEVSEGVHNVKLNRFWQATRKGTINDSVDNLIACTRNIRQS